MEKNKKKKYSSITYTTGDPDLNIKHFNDRMGTSIEPENSEPVLQDQEVSFNIADLDSQIDTSPDSGEGFSESLITEAKRETKRYYIRPQNIFCANKTDILKALAEIGDANCSIYTLKNLEDHDDVHKLTNQDIIYYYDNNVLYDKNHVQILDYALSIKNEEQRKKFHGDVENVEDETFIKAYDDRLTDRTTELEESYCSSLNKYGILILPEKRISEYGSEQTALNIFNNLKARVKAEPFDFKDNYEVKLYQIIDENTVEYIDRFCAAELLDNLLNAKIETPFEINFEADNTKNSVEESIAEENKENEEGQMKIESLKNNILNEDLATIYKYDIEAENAFNAEWVIRLNEYLENRKPTINLKLEKNPRGSLEDSVLTVVQEAVLASFEDGTQRIYFKAVEKYLKWKDRKARVWEVYADDLFKDKNGILVRPKTRIQTDWKDYKGISYIDDHAFIKLLEKMAQEKLKLFKQVEAEYKVKNSREKRIQRRADNLNDIRDIINALSDSDRQIIKNWLKDHTTKILFKIPHIDDDLEGLDYSFGNNYRQKIFDRFEILEQDFFNAFPDAKEGRDFIYRNTGNESDTHYNMWQLSGTITFNDSIETAPDEVINLMEAARAIAERNGHEIKDIKTVKESNRLDSYYFCVGVVLLFDGSLDFIYTGKGNKSSKKSIDLINGENEFDLDFDDVNAYGETITEAVDKKVCCICGEEYDGYGNNPAPYKESGKCCDSCNLKFVVPARLAAVEVKTDQVGE